MMSQMKNAKIQKKKKKKKGKKENVKCSEKARTFIEYICSILKPVRKSAHGTKCSTGFFHLRD